MSWDFLYEGMNTKMTTFPWKLYAFRRIFLRDTRKISADRLSGPTQPPIKWVPGFFSPGVKRSRRGVNHPPASGTEVKEE
jgi:hypothetical protein